MASASANLRALPSYFGEQRASQLTPCYSSFNPEYLLTGHGAVFHVTRSKLAVVAVVSQQIELVPFLLMNFFYIGQLLHGFIPLRIALTKIAVWPPYRHQKSKGSYKDEQTECQTHTGIHALSTSHDLVITMVPGGSRPTLSFFLQWKRRVITEHEARLNITSFVKKTKLKKSASSHRCQHMVQH